MNVKEIIISTTFEKLIYAYFREIDLYYDYCQSGHKMFYLDYKYRLENNIDIPSCPTYREYVALYQKLASGMIKFGEIWCFSE